jgi:hypothetical protein
LALGPGQALSGVVESKSMDRGIDIHGQGNRNPWAGEMKSMGRGHKSMGRGTEIHVQGNINPYVGEQKSLGSGTESHGRETWTGKQKGHVQRILNLWAGKHKTADRETDYTFKHYQRR